MKRSLLVISASLLLSGLSAPAPAAELEVVLEGGKRLRAREVSYDGDLALLTLPDGGLIGVSTDRIVRVDPAAESVPVAPAPSPEPAPAAPESLAAAEHGERASGEPLLLGAVPSWAPPEIVALIREAAARHDVDAELLRCLIQTESSFNPRSLSPKGAMGLAQLMPGTAADLDVDDPFDPAQAVDAAARHLKTLLERNGGAFVAALAAYNAGQGAVERYGGLPPFGETIRYVERILALYAAP